jgi:DNA-binding response OmpR family regulator
VAVKTILIVENDEIIRTRFGEVLSRNGFGVVLAANGREALDYLQAHDVPDLLILDMRTPVMDGWQFLEERNARWNAVPVLIVTGLDIASDEWAASLGVRCWALKPLHTAELVGWVKKCLGAANRGDDNPDESQR